MKENRFGIKKDLKVVAIIIAVLCIIIYFVIDNINIKDFRLTSSIKELATIVFSVVISSSITAWLIQPPEYNKIMDSVLFDGVLTNKFLNWVPLDERKKYLENLQLSIYDNESNLSRQIYQATIENASPSDNNNICYLSFKVDVNCIINENEIVKNVSQEMKVASLGDKIKIRDFLVLKRNYNDDVDKPTVIDSVYVDNEKREIKSDEGYEPLTILGSKYKHTKSFAIAGFICVPKYTDENSYTLIKLSYTSTVAKNDLSYVFRVMHPCRNFSIKYTIKDNDEGKQYRCIGHGFGYKECGNSRGILNDEQSVNIDFDRWIFEYDGVTVLMEKK